MLPMTRSWPYFFSAEVALSSKMLGSVSSLKDTTKQFFAHKLTRGCSIFGTRDNCTEGEP